MDINEEWKLFKSYKAEDLADKKIGWKKKVEQKQFANGYKCTVYQRKQKGIAGDLLRIECEFENCTVEEVVDYFVNPPPTKMFKEFRDIEKLNDGSIIKYIRVGMPMMSDRDNVLFVSQMKVDDGVLLTLRTVEHPAMPPIPKVVRMYNHIVCFCKQSGNNVIMLDFEYANLKGYLPASLLNMAVASETAKQFATMMKHIQAK